MSRSIFIPLLIFALLMTTGVVSGRPAVGPQPPREATSDNLIAGQEGFDGFIIDERGDTVYMATIASMPFFANKKDFRAYQKLVRNVKKVYPYAKDARKYMDYLEAELPKIEDKRAKEELTKSVEKEIIKKYTPVLERMTRSEGQVLIKLIYRETNVTSYKILRDFRGGFSAGFWNTIARLFKANLKQTYDPKGEDRIIEQIILNIEAGLL